MADLTVDYVVLDRIVRSLSQISAEFEDLHKRREEETGIWGGYQVRSAMGNFASNWDVHRETISEQLRTLGEKCVGITEEFRAVDQALAHLGQSRAL
jgi:hypothetical protein